MEGAIVVGTHLWRYRSWFERLEATAKYGNKYNLFFLNRKSKCENYWVRKRNRHCAPNFAHHSRLIKIFFLRPSSANTTTCTITSLQLIKMWCFIWSPSETLFDSPVNRLISFSLLTQLPSMLMRKRTMQAPYSNPLTTSSSRRKLGSNECLTCH